MLSARSTNVPICEKSKISLRSIVTVERAADKRGLPLDGGQNLWKFPLVDRLGQHAFEAHPRLVDRFPRFACQCGADHAAVHPRGDDRRDHAGRIGRVAQQEVRYRLGSEFAVLRLEREFRPCRHTTPTPTRRQNWWFASARAAARVDETRHVFDPLDIAVHPV